VAWWSRKRVETRSVSVSDYPAFAGLFSIGMNDAGVPVTERSSLGASAVWRAVSLVAGTIGGLPMPTFRQLDDGTRQTVTSFLDDRPAGPAYDLTPFEWKETIGAHLLLWGNAYLVHLVNEGGGLVGAVPFHPGGVLVDWERIEGRATGRKTFQVSDVDGGTHVLTADQVTHIPGLCFDGLRGYSVLDVARNSLGKSIAADRAAARSYGNGALMGGLVTPDDDATQFDGQAVKDELNRVTAGWEHAGQLAVLNRKLKVQPWTMSMVDAQFIESRQFEVTEIGRWFGVAPHLLMDPGAVSTWGTGVEIMNRGLARYTLRNWTGRMEPRISRMLSRPRYVEFDYSGLVKPAAEVDIPLQISLVDAGLITANEARRRLGLDQVDGGDVLRPRQSAVAAPEPVGVPR
jgi:HK97 family phage portal protein